MQSRAQSAIEILSTYGLAILVIAVVIAIVLINLGGNSQPTSFLSQTCTLQPSLPCVGTALSAYTQNQPITYTVIFSNFLGMPISFPSSGAVSVTTIGVGNSGQNTYTGTCTPALAEPGSRVTCIISISGTTEPSIGTQTTTPFTISYSICNQGSINTTGCSGLYNSTGTSIQPFSSSPLNFYYLTFSILPGTGIIYLNGVGYANSVKAVLPSGTYYIFGAPPKGYSFSAWSINSISSTLSSTTTQNTIINLNSNAILSVLFLLATTTMTTTVTTTAPSTTTSATTTILPLALDANTVSSNVQASSVSANLNHAANTLIIIYAFAYGCSGSTDSLSATVGGNPATLITYTTADLTNDLNAAWYSYSSTAGNDAVQVSQSGSCYISFESFSLKNTASTSAFIEDVNTNFGSGSTDAVNVSAGAASRWAIQGVSCHSGCAPFTYNNGQTVLALGVVGTTSYVANSLAQIMSTSSNGGAYWESIGFGVLPSKANAFNSIPITLTNNQGTATLPQFQQMLTVNSLAYQKYINSGWNNVEFTTSAGANGILLSSWVESNPSNTATNTVVWINLPNSIAANSNTVIYMDFMPSNVMSSSGPTGEAPQLSSTYGQYDNGASVFGNLYTNFAGTSTPSGWTVAVGSVTINNGVTIPWANDPGNYFYTSSSSYGVNANQILDMYGTYSGTTQSPSGVGYVADTACIPDGADIVTDGSSHLQGMTVSVDCNGAYDSYTSSFSSTTANYVSSIYWANSISARFYTNYVSQATSSTNVYGTPTHVGFYNRGFSPGGGSIGPFYWIRIRTYPPSGTMPSASFGSVQ